MSYLLTAACIISTAQHAKPKVKGHNEPARAQVISDSTLDDSHSNFIIYLFSETAPYVVRKTARPANTVHRPSFPFTDDRGKIVHPTYSRISYPR